MLCSSGSGDRPGGMALVTTWPLPAAQPGPWAPHRASEGAACALQPEGGSPIRRALAEARAMWVGEGSPCFQALG